MIAIDTNVLIRYIAADHPEQSARARLVVEAGAVWVATTVLMESEWVLRSGYGFDPERIAAAFRGFLGLPGVVAESPDIVDDALRWFERGLDFADAVHLRSAAGCEAFVSFDAALVRAARRLDLKQVRAA